MGVDRAMNGFFGRASASITASSTLTIGFAFVPALASDDYTVSIEVEDSSNSLRILNITSKTASQVNFRVQNTDGSDHTGTFHLVCIAD